MTLRRIAAVILIIFAATAALAQKPAAAPEPAEAATPAETVENDSRQVREELLAILRLYPPHVGGVLKLDPTLLTNEAWLTPYPALAKFIAEHPEVTRGPEFYLEGISVPYDLPIETGSQKVWRDVTEGVSIFVVMLIFVGTFTWLVRTLIDHRRWSRVSKIQSEVHTKLLDRFSANEDLLSYIQTPAGRKFLESTPIALDGPRAISAPLNRVLWSVQAGLVLIFLGFGLQWVSGNIADKDVVGPVSAMGVLGIAIGLGFVASAVVSYLLARRLGLWEPPAQAVTE